MTAWLLPVAAALLWAGMLVRPLLGTDAPFAALIALGACSLVGALALVLTRVRSREGAAQVAGSVPAVAALIAAVGLVVLGIGWNGWRAEAAAHPFLGTRAEHPVTISGSLRTDPSPGAFGWSAVLSATRLEDADEAFSLREPVWVSAHGDLPGARRGDRIAVDGTLEAPTDDFAGFLRSKGIGVELNVETMRTLGPPLDPIGRLASSARAFLQASLARLFEPREAGLMMGLALGDTTELDPGLERDFRATGLSHLLAVSGGNVAMVLAPVLALLSLLRAPPSVRFIIGVATVVFFVILTGAEPSVLRAGVMAGIALTGVLLGRARSTAGVLAASVVVLLLLDPFLAGSLGFQLSVSATAGLAAMAGPLAAKLAWMPRPLAVAVAATLAAQIGVAPLLLFAFGWIPLVAIPANVLAFAAVAPAMLLGLAAAATSPFLPWLGSLLAGLARLPLGYLEAVADRLASVPLPSLTSHGGVGALVVGGAILAVSVWWVRRDKRPIPRAVLLGAITVVPVVVFVSGLQAGAPGRLEIRFLDVGQGDAALVRSPAGATILVDAGPEPDDVANDLAALGVRRLDAVVATHAHADHIAGFPTVFARVPIGLVLEPGCRGTAPAYADFVDAIGDEEIPVRHPRIGDVFSIGDVRIDVLAPSVCAPMGDENDDSLVTRISVGGDTVLFTGDAEVPEQTELLESGIDLRADVLKVPHHGGDTSVPELFAAVDAPVGSIGVGEENSYGHPNARVLKLLGEAGTQVFRTDAPGDEDIVVTFEGDPAASDVAVRYEAA